MVNTDVYFTKHKVNSTVTNSIVIFCTVLSILVCVVSGAFVAWCIRDVENIRSELNNLRQQVKILQSQVEEKSPREDDNEVMSTRSNSIIRRSASLLNKEMSPNSSKYRTDNKGDLKSSSQRKKIAGQPRRRHKDNKRTVAVQFEGTGSISRPENVGIFTHWKYAPWVTRRMKRDFKFDKNGKITVKSKGIYMFYSQILLLDEVKHGYVVYQNKEIIARCMQSYSNDSEMKISPVTNSSKSVSCNTFGIFNFKDGDELYLSHIYDQKASDFSKYSSFFGLYKIS